MIHIIEGRIGSGKTYWCVSYILRLFFIWDERFFEYFPKGEVPKIYTNVSGLKIGNVLDISVEIQKKGGLDEFFKVNPVSGELLNDDLKNSIIIIDEAQGPAWFHRRYSNPHVMLFFQLHRHFGCDVFLCTQDVKSLCPELRELPEYHLRVTRQSLQLGNYFTYKKYFDDEPGPSTRLKKDQRVFSCYKSVEKGVVPKKITSVLYRYIFIVVFSVILIIVGGYAMKRYFFSPHLKNDKVASSAAAVVHSGGVVGAAETAMPLFIPAVEPEKKVIAESPKAERRASTHGGEAAKIEDGCGKSGLAQIFDSDGIEIFRREIKQNCE